MLLRVLRSLVTKCGSAVLYNKDGTSHLQREMLSWILNLPRVLLS